jgi:ketosteroid isomerase-like protein
VSWENRAVPDPLALARRYHEALNRYDVAVVAPMFAEDAVYLSPGVGALFGRAAIIDAFTSYFSEYADQVAQDDTLVAVGTHQVRSEWRLEASSSKTGAKSIRQGTEIITFDDRGLISRVEVEDRCSTS